ncbi:MAG: transketolase [Chitinophagales bacterium]|nr:thiamine pyrophosphate-dependent enzyme [Chitinophagales bacterium]MCZ2394619.1 transketolase [Chitinophagales bacterium]
MADSFTGNIFETNQTMSFEDFRREVLDDFKIANISREISLLGRKEVLTGKAKFGIFGGGKELPQIAMAKVFQNGDFRAGYYRDQTFALATKMVTIEHLFGQLYANPNLAYEPHSAGRQMNNHFATRNLKPDGSWKNLTQQKNSAADNSPTANQMLRALGLALASKKYRELKNILEDERFSINGDEVCFVSIGDASTSEGFFWEVLNAACVQQVPMIVNVWDDGYGISVPKSLQTAKSSISEASKGFQGTAEHPSLKIVKVKGWDYPELLKTYKEIIADVRANHQPVLVHIEDLIQIQGHSTSGSHERYKSKERLAWEKEMDGIHQMQQWILQNHLASQEELQLLKAEAKEDVRKAQKKAWSDFNGPIHEELMEALSLMEVLQEASVFKDNLKELIKEVKYAIEPTRRDFLKLAHEVLLLTREEQIPERQKLSAWYEENRLINKERFCTYLHTNSIDSPLKYPIVPVEYEEKPKILSGYQVLNLCFDMNLDRDPHIIAFGEDVGYIGDVNQAFNGLQEKYGKERVYDTGIREASIIGEGIGLAMRGLRPIAEIQYLDYINYALSPLMDDLACLSYRTKGGQKAPLIIRTRGHRLEGIWHTGSPMSMLLGSLRGIHICVPRNMTQAAGFYNLLLRCDEPALVIECLNGYRLKEKIPSNPGDFTVPLGVPEILKEGKDISLVTYGSCVRIAQDAIHLLEEVGVSVELIDVQTLLPFDIHGLIGQSVRKTNKVVFLDEDVPGGASAYMLEQTMTHQNIFNYLDAAPVCMSATQHRASYGSDGDYFCKPNAEDIFNQLYQLMNNHNPIQFPIF